MSYYAACASDNFVSSVAGQSIQSILNPNGYAQNLVSTSATTAYDCCVAALLDPVGSVFQYNPGYGCTILEATQCTAFDQSFVWTPYIGNAGQTFVGNAYCGSMGKPPAPAQCGNGGMKWALYYDNDYAAWNNPNVWDPTYIQSESPLTSPAVTYAVGGNTQGGPDVNIYNSGISWGTEHRMINQVGYIYAPVTGTYTLSFPYVNDMLAVWIGPNAYSGWTRANAITVVTYYGASVTYDMTAGQYYPIRLVFENTWGGGGYSAHLYDPQGNDLFTTGTNDQPNLIQYSCDQTTAPPFPDLS